MCTGGKGGWGPRQTLLTQVFDPQQSESVQQKPPSSSQGGLLFWQTLLRQEYDPQQSDWEEQTAPTATQEVAHTPFTQRFPQHFESEEQRAPATMQTSESSRLATSPAFKGTDAPRAIKAKATTIEVLKNFISLEGSV